MKKKVLVALLSLSLIVTMMPAPIFASNSLDVNSKTEVAKEAKQVNKNLQDEVYHKATNGQSDMVQETFYKIETINPDHGSVKALIDGKEVNEAAEGTLVNLKTIMRVGWRADVITVMKGEEPVEVSKDKDFVMPGGDVKIYVQESQVDYRIQIINMEHVKVQAFVDGKPTTTAHGGDQVKLVATTDEGWEVAQFLVKYGRKYLRVDEDNQFDMPYGAVGVLAHITRKKATVSFDSMGGTPVESQKIAIGNTAKKPADPTKDGYRFMGWYLDKEGKTPFDFNTPITGDTTLYAEWGKEVRPGPPLPHPPKPVPILEDVTSMEQVTAMATAQKAEKEIATGDSSMIILFAGLGAVAIGTALVIGLRRKEHK